MFSLLFCLLKPKRHPERRKRASAIISLLVGARDLVFAVAITRDHQITAMRRFHRRLPPPANFLPWCPKRTILSCSYPILPIRVPSVSIRGEGFVLSPISAVPAI